MRQTFQRAPSMAPSLTPREAPITFRLRLFQVTRSQWHQPKSLSAPLKRTQRRSLLKTNLTHNSNLVTACFPLILTQMWTGRQAEISHAISMSSSLELEMTTATACLMCQPPNLCINLSPPLSTIHSHSH